MNFGPASSSTQNFSNFRCIQISDAQLARPTAELLANTGVIYQLASGVSYTSSGTSLSKIGTFSPIVVSGLPAIGSVLTATLAPGWINTNGNWQRNGSPISGQTSLTYTTTLSDALSAINFVSANLSFASNAILTSDFVPPAVLGASNWKVSNTSNLRAGMAAVKAGTGRLRILMLGDSYLAGFGSTDNAMGSNARSGSWPTRLATLLAASGTPATSASTVGDGNEQASDIPSLLAYDYRLSSNNATILQGYTGIGGGSSSLIRLTNAGDSFTFTPGEAFDTVDLAFPANIYAQGSFDVVVGGSVVRNIANNAFQGVAKATVSVPSNSSAVTLKQNTGSAYSMVTSCRTAATPKVEIINAGASGLRVAAMAVAPTYSGDTQTWNTRACLPVLLDNAAYNVVILNGWYNDKNGGISQTDTQANLQTLINDIKALGADCIYVNYSTLDPGVIDGASFLSWSSAMIGTAQATNDLPVFDMSKVIPNYNSGNAAGYYFDSLHLRGPGQQLFAQSLKACIDSVTKG